MSGDPLTSIHSMVCRLEAGPRMVDASLLKKVYLIQGLSAKAAALEDGPRLLNEAELRELATFMSQMSLVDTFQETGERLIEGAAFKALASTSDFPPIPVIAIPPVISGATTVGSVLSATSGTWDNSPTSYYYDWRRDGVGFGQHGTTYTLVTADKTHSITVAVTATNGGGNSDGPAISNALAIP